MPIQIIEVPYDLAQRDRRMGCGPGHLIRRGAVQALRVAGHAVHRERLDLDGRSDFPIEIATAFELQRLISGRQAGARYTRELIEFRRAVRELLRESAEKLELV